MLSSKVRVVAVLAGLLLAVPALTFAQGQGRPGGGGRGGFGGGRGGFGGGGGISGLLRMEEVHKEISVTDEQKAELTKIGESLRPAGGAAGFNQEEFAKLSEEERAKRFDEMRKEGEARSQKADEAIKALLKPEQWTRLSELRTQQDGVRGLTREETQKQLSLTEEQVAKIKTLTDAQRAGGGAGGGGANFQDMSEEDRRKFFEEATKRREAYDKDMAAVLTAEQTAAWEKSKGAKFDFPSRGPGGPGGGRGGAPGGTRPARPL